MNDTEYSILRQQINHLDKTCLIILGFLLTASTAIYSLVIEDHAYHLLIFLSILWIIGFAYICEKRFWIRKTAFYLRDCIEKNNDNLNWQTWLKKKENNKKFIRFSPLILEFCLLVSVITTNVIWLYNQFGKSINLSFDNLQSYIYILIALLLGIILLWEVWAVIKYYFITRKA